MHLKYESQYSYNKYTKCASDKNYTTMQATTPEMLAN